jgi:hypothetical protein
MMQSKLESLDNYKSNNNRCYNSNNNRCHCIWLLKQIQGITQCFEGTRIVFISLDDAWTSYYTYPQSEHQLVHEYSKDYQSLVQVLEHYGAAIGAEGPYIKVIQEQIALATPSLTNVEYRERAVTAAKKQSVAIAFLTWADRKCYGGLWNELENNFTRGQDHYPVTGGYSLLLNYKTMRQPKQETTKIAEVSGVSFLQNGATTPGTDGVTHERIKCVSHQVFQL